MGYQVIQDFRGGLDARKFFLSLPPGTLTAANNCHITAGAEIEKRKAFSRSGLTAVRSVAGKLSSSTSTTIANYYKYTCNTAQFRTTDVGLTMVSSDGLHHAVIVQIDDHVGGLPPNYKTAIIYSTDTYWVNPNKGSTIYQSFFGLQPTSAGLYVFGSADAPSSLPAGLTYQKLVNPISSTWLMYELVTSCNFGGKPWVVTRWFDPTNSTYPDTFSNVSFVFYDGEALGEWWEGYLITNTSFLDRMYAKFDGDAVTETKTSGTLTVGRYYTITSFTAGDNFTNVGASSNATGVGFIATGTTPTTWTHGSTLDSVAGIAGFHVEYTTRVAGTSFRVYSDFAIQFVVVADSVVGTSTLDAVQVSSTTSPTAGAGAASALNFTGGTPTSGILYAVANPNVGDQIKIGTGASAVTYTFVAAINNLNLNEILHEAAVIDTLQNVVYAINKDTGHAAKFSTATAVNPFATAAIVKLADGTTTDPNRIQISALSSQTSGQAYNVTFPTNTAAMVMGLKTGISRLTVVSADGSELDILDQTLAPFWFTSGTLNDFTAYIAAQINAYVDSFTATSVSNQLSIYATNSAGSVANNYQVHIQTLGDLCVDACAFLLPLDATNTCQSVKVSTKDNAGVFQLSANLLGGGTPARTPSTGAGPYQNSDVAFAAAVVAAIVAYSGTSGYTAFLNVVNNPSTQVDAGNIVISKMDRSSATNINGDTLQVTLLTNSAVAGTVFGQTPVFGPALFAAIPKQVLTRVFGNVSTPFNTICNPSGGSGSYAYRWSLGGFAMSIYTLVNGVPTYKQAQLNALFSLITLPTAISNQTISATINPSFGSNGGVLTANDFYVGTFTLNCIVTDLNTHQDALASQTFYML